MWMDYKPGHDTGPDKIADGNIGNEANWTGGVHRNTSTSPTLSGTSCSVNYYISYNETKSCSLW